jgi:hypothetical protein
MVLDLEEAELTLDAAKAIYDVSGGPQRLWAQVVKNGYDAIEQAAKRVAEKHDGLEPSVFPVAFEKDEVEDLIEEFDAGGDRITVAAVAGTMDAEMTPLEYPGSISVPVSACPPEEYFERSEVDGAFPGQDVDGYGTFE